MLKVITRDACAAVRNAYQLVWLPVLLGTALLGLLLATYPLALLGANAALGLAAVGVGIQWGGIVAGIAGAAFLVGLGTVEYEGGQRVARLLAGNRLGTHAWVLLAAAVVFAVSVGVLVALMTIAAAGVDLVLASTADSSVDVYGFADGGDRDSLVRIGAGSMTLVIITWLLVLGQRSGRWAALALVGALASWMGALVATRAVDDRRFLALHPAAAPWQLGYPGAAPSLTVDAPSQLLWCSALAWSAVVIFAAARGARKP